MSKVNMKLVNTSKSRGDALEKQNPKKYAIKTNVKGGGKGKSF